MTQTFREWVNQSSGAVSQAALSAQLRTVRDTARTAICADAYARARAFNRVSLAATCFQGGHDVARGVDLGHAAVDGVRRIGSPPRVLAYTRQTLLHATTPYADRPDVADLRRLITTTIATTTTQDDGTRTV